MSNHETLAAALLAAFNLDADKADPAITASAAAGVLVALQEPVLVELRKQTTLLQVIAEQGERTLEYIEGASDPICGAATSGLSG